RCARPRSSNRPARRSNAELTCPRHAAMSNPWRLRVGSSRLVNRNVTALRGRTSMRLEPELWEALEEICRREKLTLGEVVKRVEQRGHPGGRTSAVRVHVLGYFRDAVSE